MRTEVPPGASNHEPSNFEIAHLAKANLRQQHIDHLEDQIRELAAHIHAATFRLLELLREYDECEGWAKPGLRSCAHWLNWKCGISLGAAREKMRVAHALKKLPRISAVFREGRVSYSKVRAMTRVATAKNEDYLLEIAKYGTAYHVERLVRLYRQVKRTEALSAENQRYDHRELSWYVDDDGYWVIRGRLTAEQGALIQRSLEAVMEKNYQEKKNVTASTCCDEWGNELPPDREPIALRRADALVRMAQECASDRENSSGGGDRFLVHVHTNIETLKNDGTGAEAELEDFGNVPAETSRRIACDAGVVHWLENSAAETLNVGRKTRSIPPSIRRALHKRDGGCRFPGCTCSRFVDAHHIRHWADGGETSMDNLILLCRHHHRLVHEGGFGLQQTANGDLRFSDPAGKILPTGPDQRSRGNVGSLFHEHEENGIHITPKSTDCHWLGEEMDDQLAVEGLLYSE